MPGSGRRRVGVLALQGAVAEHRRALEALGARTVAVRTPADLAGLDGLVLPGGESTALVRLAASTGLAGAIAGAHAAGLGLFGTCAGIVLLASRVTDGDALASFPRIPVLDVEVTRNAYGSQRASFVADLDPTEHLGGGVRGAAFIRAPRITHVGPGVQVLARHAGDPVLVASGAPGVTGRATAAGPVLPGPVLAGTFHTELGDDRTLHRLFLDMLGAGEDAGAQHWGSAGEPRGRTGRNPGTLAHVRE
ncbi:pyridoxal 5'-phosphate synthase glutaminase subunit PdxT [Brevibacterium litoralis]|uniref:pyridoxal 5'-phosphate synthase glutaminase subunit PdxT n=1 Tax=Brevibacterium litoralis TaxID=3138935 RepID=UPI0032ED3702